MAIYSVVSAVVADSMSWEDIAPTVNGKGQTQVLTLHTFDISLVNNTSDRHNVGDSTTQQETTAQLLHGLHSCCNSKKDNLNYESLTH